MSHHLVVKLTSACLVVIRILDIFFVFSFTLLFGSISYLLFRLIYLLHYSYFNDNFTELCIDLFTKQVFVLVLKYLKDEVVLE